MSRFDSTWLNGAALLAATVLLAPAPLTAEAGWQVDLKLGQSTLEETFAGVRTKFFDDESEATGVEIGYHFNDYFGIQAGYHDLGTFQGFGPYCADDDEVCHSILALWAPVPFEAAVTGWSLAAVPSWPLTERLSAYGKVGFLDWENDMTPAAELAGEIEFESVSDRDLLTALGVRYRFRKSLGALLEYQRLDLDLGSASLGVTWRF